MTETIKECLAKCQTSILPSVETKSIPFTDRIGSELKQAIQDSVQVLSRKRVLAEKVDVNWKLVPWIFISKWKTTINSSCFGSSSCIDLFSCTNCKLWAASLWVNLLASSLN